MDRIINNESVAICAILNSLVLGIDDIARLQAGQLYQLRRDGWQGIIILSGSEQEIRGISACVFECYNDAFDGWKD